MSIVSLLGINVLNNPAKFTDPYEFEITFECLEPLKNDLEWKLTYVGSSRSLEHDQELDSILVGPVPVGVNKFLFTADPPSPELIPASELVSVTVILLSCSYDGREFVRVGYYVNNEYDDEEMRENPPAKVQVDHVVRNILAEKPRVTRFNIVWDNEQGQEYPPEQPDVEEEDEEEEEEEEEEEDDDEEEDDENDEAEAEKDEKDNPEVQNREGESEPDAKRRKVVEEDEAEEIDLEDDADSEGIEIEETPGEGSVLDTETVPTPQDSTATSPDPK
ncbi:LAMI_0G14708g1_1 [Lachancea mirantina]|uniref:Histone chaperone n=1 Tax=Lachancea mirantina TaxID=1230905 RepID=A0A1G4KCG2_9SACH|nr:LAMI_0G14708g1_1 [Lachancea mirantina]